jgi:hypothetical protein
MPDARVHAMRIWIEPYASLPLWHTTDLSGRRTDVRYSVFVGTDFALCLRQTAVWRVLVNR